MEFIDTAGGAAESTHGPRVAAARRGHAGKLHTIGRASDAPTSLPAPDAPGPDAPRLGPPHSHVPLLLPGSVTSQMVRCGRESCRCAQGELHGPYYYRVWREGDKVHKVYVPLRDLEAVRAACEAQRAADWEQERQGRESPMNARMEAVLSAGRNTARQSARALASAALALDANVVAREAGTDAASVTARARRLDAPAAKASAESRKAQGAEPNGLSLRLRSYEEAVVLEADGEAALPSACAFRAALGHAAATCRGRRLYVDLRGITLMDGSAWAALVDTAREIRERPGAGRLCVLLLPGSAAGRAFTLMRLHMVMDRAESLGERRDG